MKWKDPRMEPPYYPRSAPVLWEHLTNLKNTPYKEELHATTALKEPRRNNSCRVGLVLYQHVMLHLPQHGCDVIKRKNASKEQLAGVSEASMSMLVSISLVVDLPDIQYYDEQTIVYTRTENLAYADLIE